jgi:predicted  nucleic acid-binding Zn-ribbon protein
MSYTHTCPECGSNRLDHHHGSDVAASHTSERDVRFAQVLNGSQWRQRPDTDPRHRDDIVPND